MTDPRQLDWCEAHCRATAIAAFRREVIATAELALTRLAVTEAGDLPGGASGPAKKIWGLSWRRDPRR